MLRRGTERTRVREQQTAIATANRNRGRAANHGSPPALPRDGVKRPNRRSAARPPHRPAAPQPANRGNRPTRAGSGRRRRNRKKRRSPTLQPRSPNTQRLEKNADSALQPDRSPARVRRADRRRDERRSCSVNALPDRPEVPIHGGQGRGPRTPPRASRPRSRERCASAQLGWKAEPDPLIAIERIRCGAWTASKSDADQRSGRTQR